MREFLWGLGVFLLGMKLMENTLLQYGVPTLKRILRNYTDKKRKSVVSGTVLACITQSSTIVSVMTVIFVGAGIITFGSGVWVIIGANVGSTLLGIVLGGAMAGSLKLSSFALPMLGAGAIGELFFKKKKKIYFVTMLLLAFGLIFFGISMINTTVSEYALSIDLSVISQRGILGYFLIGILLTALMHSSDTMLILALSFLAQGVIGLPEAIAIMIGANIGTTISAIEWSWSGTKEQKQVALSHFLFNVISAIIALPLLSWSISLLQFFFDLPNQNIWAVVMYDFWYNLLWAALFYPFLRQYVWLLEKLVSPTKNEISLYSTHTDIHDIKKALIAFRKDVLMLFDKVYKCNLTHLGIDSRQLILLKEWDTPHQLAHLKMDNDNIEQDYKVILTIEETLMQAVVKVYQANKHKEHHHEELFMLREAIERMVYSVKALHDSKVTLDELYASKTPLILDYLEEFRNEMGYIYSMIAACIQGSVTAKQRKALDIAFDELVSADERFLTDIGDEVSQDVLSNRQLSSLVHLAQGINRSHKAILHTIDILYPKKKQ